MDTINQRDICTIFAISLRDIILVRLLCNNISQSKRYIPAAKFVVTICRSELHFNTSTIYRNEAIVFDESVFVYMQWAQSSNKLLNTDQNFACEKLSMLCHNQQFPLEGEAVSEVYVEDVFVIQEALQRESQHEVLDQSVFPKANGLRNFSVSKKGLRSTQ